MREKFRGSGYGQRLLGELAKEVVDMDGGRLEWAVLKWNTPSIQFYERIGAKALTEWQTMRVDSFLPPVEYRVLRKALHPSQKEQKWLLKRS